ncbi:MAG: hypothetical protein K8Q99_04555 [Acholeplasmataceae bacterium]|nr:hypothetical protein [Acholeplasmataceae bacterium]
MANLKNYFKITFYMISGAMLLFVGLYLLGYKFAFFPSSQYIQNFIKTLDNRLLIAAIIFIFTLLAAQLAKTSLNVLATYRKQLKYNKKDKETIAHQIFLVEKQKIKDAMFKDYMKHQRK